MVQESIGLFIGASASGLKAITFALLVSLAHTDTVIEEIAVASDDVALMIPFTV